MAALTLRPMIDADLPAKVRWANDPRVNEWIAMPERVDLAGTQRWFASVQSNPRALLFTILLSEQPIGFARLERSEDGCEGEYCGLVIGEPEHWGRGLGKAAAAEVLRVAFEQERWQRLWGYWPAWNHRSIALHQKLGFELAGIAEHKRRYLDGREHDQMILAITQARWLAALS